MGNEINSDAYRDFTVKGKPVDSEKSKVEKQDDGSTVFHGCDADGNEVFRMTDSNSDGFFETLSRINPDGTVSEELIENTGDCDYDMYVSYQYDAGYTYGQESVRNVDEDLDGKVDVSSKFDKMGRVVSEDIDDTHDGKLNLHVDYIYNKAGKISERVIDYNKDGVPDYMTTLDDNDRIIADDMDFSRNGVLDAHVEYTYDDNGNIKSAKLRQLYEMPEGKNFPKDSKVDGARVFDAQGNQIGIIVPMEKDGQKVQKMYSIGTNESVTYSDGVTTTTDKTGKVLSEDIDSDKDGVPDTHIEYSYESGEQTVAKKNKIAQIKDDSIPSDFTVRGNKIFDANGNQCGLYVMTVEDGKAAQHIYAIGDEIPLE